MKISGNTESIIQLKKDKVGVDIDGKAKSRGRYKFNNYEFNCSEIEGNEVGDDKVPKEKNYQKMSKSKKTIRSSDFLSLGAKLVFTKLKQVFVKAPILYHF